MMLPRCLLNELARRKLGNFLETIALIKLKSPVEAQPLRRYTYKLAAILISTF